ncbi:unnamed protein product, partial [Didymodactylos carnosus]
MAAQAQISSFDQETPDSPRASKIPLKWIIFGVIFYIASLLTVGLLAGLLPKRVQQIQVIGTPEPEKPSTISQPTQRTSVSTPLPSTDDNVSTDIFTVTPYYEPCNVTNFQCSLPSECDNRLPEGILPLHYELEYTIESMTQTTFKGSVKIHFKLKQPLKRLVYHVKRMTKLCLPILKYGDVTEDVNMSLCLQNECVILEKHSGKLFTEDDTINYTLYQDFESNLNDGNVGFYQSEFKDTNGDRKLLATKFQPTDARKAFPCFDEPKLKATFKITIIHPQNTIALANFPEESSENQDSLKRTTFQETFKMSTYLAAWAVVPSDFGMQSIVHENRLLRIWARKGPTDKNQTLFALEVAREAVTYFSEYFNMIDALPPKKIDLLAVPDFASGAMENWGLISFREDRLILDEKYGAAQQKQTMAETISHELAHFWFGNYVTCEWWDDLWLNEAMATWLSYKPLIKNHSEWRMDLQALTEDVIGVMWDDAKPSSHPISVQNVTTAAQITSLFDSITYSKGASILRMLEKIVGENKFRDGLRTYLSQNAFDVGNPDNFYNDFTFPNSLTGKDLMNNWLDELNYPLLNVHMTVNDNGTILNFTQSRFLISDALDSSNLNQSYRWILYIECVLGGNPINGIHTSNIESLPSFYFSTQQEIQTLNNKYFTWIKCNRNFTGFYVTSYSYTDKNSTTEASSNQMWKHFESVLLDAPEYFSDEDKTNLIHDAFLLSYKGVIEYEAPLRIVKTLRTTNNKQYVLWKTFQWHWDNLANVMEHREKFNLFQIFLINQILPSDGSITLDNIVAPATDHNERLLRALQFSSLCRMNSTDALKKASELFKSIPLSYFQNNDNVSLNISDDFLSTVYTCHIRNTNNDDDWETLYKYYQLALSPQEQLRALNAISNSKNTVKLQRLLQEGSANSSIFKIQDFFSMFSSISHNPTGRSIAWNFYRDHFQELIDRFGIDNRRLGTLVLSIARSFDSATHINEVIKQTCL